MRNRQILCKLLSKRKTHKKMYVIGVFGLHRFAGVTHITVLLAQFLSGICGRSVEVVEASGKDDLACLSLRYKTSRRMTKNSGSFVYRNITFVEQATDAEVGRLRNADYEFCILDLGSNYRRAMRELMRCDLKIIVGTAAPWQEESWGVLKDMLNELKDINTWHIISNLSRDKLTLDKKIQNKCHLIGFEPKLFHPSKEAIKVFKELLQFQI